MRYAVSLVTCCFALLAWPLSSEQEAPLSQAEWDQAEREIKRLPPSAFKHLPHVVLKQLVARDCTIPQAAQIPQMHNVIHGEFARKGQTDWAALCSKESRSAIWVFWGGPVRCRSELAPSEDRHWLQTWTPTQVAYSRHIQPVGRKYILEHYEWYSGPKPPPIDHQGIDDGFIGKGSVIYYCHEGKWLELQGAD